VLVNLLNPKLTLFFFAFLPQFVGRHGAATVRMLELSAVFMLVTLAVFVLYGLGAAAVRERLRPAALAWTRRIFGGAFVALAGKLALSSR
jgi:threonine/homoserine/homoserine lactone efflux protein